jgi:hypothetical protein
MERLEIGRALDCDIAILEPSLSRKHTELHLIDDVLQFDRIKVFVSSPT